MENKNEIKKMSNCPEKETVCTNTDSDRSPTHISIKTKHLPLPTLENNSTIPKAESDNDKNTHNSAFPDFSHTFSDSAPRQCNAILSSGL